MKKPSDRNTTRRRKSQQPGTKSPTKRQHHHHPPPPAHYYDSEEACIQADRAFNQLQQRQYRIPYNPNTGLGAPTPTFFATNPRYARIPIDQWYNNSNNTHNSPCAVGYDQRFYTAADWRELWYHAVYTSYTRMNTPHKGTVPATGLRPRVWQVMAHVRQRYLDANTPYVSLSPETTVHTLRYMFQKLQKGIFVRIRNNKLDTFLPFVRRNFTSDYYTLLFDADSPQAQADRRELEAMREAEKKLQAWDTALDSSDPEDPNVFPPRVQREYRSTLERLLRLEHSCALRWARTHPPASRSHHPDAQVKSDPNRRRWLANNHIFNVAQYFDNPNVQHFHHLFVTLTSHRKGLPDFECVLQPRDFPVLRAEHDASKGGGATTTILQPYPDVETPENRVQMRVEGGLMPVLSHTGKDGYYDVPLPTVDDIEHFEQVRFAGRCATAYVGEGAGGTVSQWVEWGAKTIAKAVFRGSATGRGITADTNLRMQAQHIAQQPEYKHLFDVHLTSLNRRPKLTRQSATDATRTTSTSTSTSTSASASTSTSASASAISSSTTSKHPTRPPVAYENPGIRTVQPAAVQSQLGAINKSFYMDTASRTQYKYNLCLDGQTRADRFAWELCTGSLVILPTRDGHRLWVEPFLVPLHWDTDIRPHSQLRALPPHLSTEGIRHAGYTHVTIHNTLELGELVQWLVAHDHVGEAAVANAKRWLFGGPGGVTLDDVVRGGGHYSRTGPSSSFLYDYMEGVVRALASQAAHSPTKPYTLVPSTHPHLTTTSPSKVVGIVVGFRDSNPAAHGARTKQLESFCEYFGTLFPTTWKRVIVVAEQCEVPGERAAFAAWWNRCSFASSTANHTKAVVTPTELRQHLLADARSGTLPVCIQRNLALVGGDVDLAVGGGHDNDQRTFWTCDECYRRVGEQKFNLGALKNVGYAHLKQVYGDQLSHVVFTDIDMLPDHELAGAYLRIPQSDEIVALATRGTAYDTFRVDGMPVYTLTGLHQHRHRHQHRQTHHSGHRHHHHRRLPGGTKGAQGAHRHTRRTHHTTVTRKSNWNSRQQQQQHPHQNASFFSRPTTTATTFRPVTERNRPCMESWVSPKRKFHRFLGAALSVSPVLFEKMNGYPNTFWGWGGEDNELAQRLGRVSHHHHRAAHKGTSRSTTAVKYTVPSRGQLIDLELDQPVTLQEKLRERVKELQKEERLAASGDTWKQDGVMQLMGSEQSDDSSQVVAERKTVRATGSLRSGRLVVRVGVVLGD